MTVEEIKKLIPDAVLLPVRRGEKYPTIENWQKMTLKKSHSIRYQTMLRETGNIGVLLGEQSGGLCSIDIDSNDLFEEFLYENRWLANGLVTFGNNGGNLWVIVEGPIPPTKKLSWGEFRSSGSQTVIAGIHPSGKPYRTASKNPPVRARFEDIDFQSLGAVPDEWEGCYTILCSIEQPPTKGGSAADRFQDAVNEIYGKFVEPYFKPVKATRNDNLVRTGSFLFYNTAPEVAVAVVMEMYDRHSHLWKDSRDRHRYEITHLINAMGAEYPNLVPEESVPLYRELSSDEKIAYRICASLALRGHKKFFLSVRELASRLGGRHPEEARRLLKKLVQCGFIKRTVPQRGRKAQDYRWVAAFPGKMPLLEVAPPRPFIPQSRTQMPPECPIPISAAG